MKLHKSENISYVAQHFRAGSVPKVAKDLPRGYDNHFATYLIQTINFGSNV